MIGIIKSIQEIYIYEDMDGIKTVHTPNPLDPDDTLHKLPLWIDILQCANNNVGLKDLLNKAEEFYHLSKDENG